MDNKSFTELRNNGIDFFIEHKAEFSPYKPLKKTTIEDVIDFAYAMTFGKEGEHRDHRSGGTYKRQAGEIFKDTFQGKVSECALYNVLYKNHALNIPNFEKWSLGVWDSEDFIIDDKKASVKSTKAFGNLLLLETKDYDSDGIYLPNATRGGNYDYIILVRIKPFCEDILRKEKILYSSTIERGYLKDMLLNYTWEYDVPGYITLEDFKTVIKKKMVIPKGSKLNGKVIMDADNYYVQAGELRPINTL